MIIASKRKLANIPGELSITINNSKIQKLSKENLLGTYIEQLLAGLAILSTFSKKKKKKK